MARLPNQKLNPGMPAKPPGLTKKEGAEWDRLLREMEDSNIPVSKMHRAALEQAAVLSIEIAAARETVELEGAYFENAKTGGMQLHPAARRLDGLRRDYIKVLSILGMRSIGAKDAGGKPSGEGWLDEE